MGNGKSTLTSCSNGAITEGQMPIIYHPDYNVRFFGLQKLHPFDSCKYEKIVAGLEQQGTIPTGSWISPTGEASRETLLSIHTAEYLDSLDNAATVAEICEMSPLAYLPNSTVQNRILKPMRTATAGTILAGEVACKAGWAINLGGGYHHASSAQGGGWCIFSDIFLSYHNLIEKSKGWDRPIQKCMIVDLDVHQGNGLALDKREFHGKGAKKKDVFIIDMYNHALWPADDQARESTNLPLAVTPSMNDDEYCSLLKTAIDDSLGKFTPDVIYYNAGTDVLIGDPLNGGVKISQEGVIERDQIVFEAALSRGIPIVMVLSGGYATTSGQAVIASVTNLIDGPLKILEQVRRPEGNDDVSACAAEDAILS